MTTKERKELLDRLNERLSDKTLSFGCRITHNQKIWIVLGEVMTGEKTRNYQIVHRGFKQILSSLQIEFDKTLEVIGHPVTLGRLFLEMLKTNELFKSDTILELWDFEHDILESQSDECLNVLDGIFFK